MDKELDEALECIESHMAMVQSMSPYYCAKVISMSPYHCAKVIASAYRFSQSTIRAQEEEIAGLKDERKDLLAQRPVWRCFHCGEVFKQHQAASDHFSIEGIPPLCVDPLTKDEKARMVVVRKLESELAKWRKENEELDHQAQLAHVMRTELGQFGMCGGVKVSSVQGAWLVHEAMIGAKEAATQRAEQAESSLAAMTKERDSFKKKWLDGVDRANKDHQDRIDDQNFFRSSP